jgi:hypothetical protein
MNHHLPHYLYVVFLFGPTFWGMFTTCLVSICEFILLWTSLNTSYFDLFMVWSCHKRCIVLSNLVGYCTNAIRKVLCNNKDHPLFPNIGYKVFLLPWWTYLWATYIANELNWMFQPIFQVQLDTPCFGIFNPIFLIPRFHL